jgi:hypothetical protein
VCSCLGFCIQCYENVFISLLKGIIMCVYDFSARIILHVLVITIKHYLLESIRSFFI